MQLMLLAALDFSKKCCKIKGNRSLCFQISKDKYVDFFLKNIQHGGSITRPSPLGIKIMTEHNVHVNSGCGYFTVLIGLALTYAIYKWAELGFPAFWQ